LLSLGGASLMWPAIWDSAQPVYVWR